jgi:hypothetical protein
MTRPLLARDLWSTAVVLPSCEASHAATSTTMRAVLDKSLADFAAAEPPPWQIPHDDSTIGVRADLVRPLFAHDFDDTTVAAAAARLTRQSAVVFGQCPTAAAWQEIPSTYVICADDRATPPRSSARTPRGPRKWWSYRSPTIPSSPGRTCRPR